MICLLTLLALRRGGGVVDLDILSRFNLLLFRVDLLFSLFSIVLSGGNRFKISLYDDFCVVVPVRLDADHSSTWNMPHQHVINFFGRAYIAAIGRL